MITRAKKMVILANKENLDQPPEHPIFLPKYETTNGTTAEERDFAIMNWDIDSLISEDKTSGSEYVPSISSDFEKQNGKNNKWDLFNFKDDENINTKISTNRKVKNWLRNQFKSDTPNKSKKKATDCNANNNKIHVIQNIVLRTSVENNDAIFETAPKNKIPKLVGSALNIRSNDEKSTYGKKINDIEENLKTPEFLSHNSLHSPPNCNTVENNLSPGALQQNMESITYEVHVEKSDKIESIIINNAESKNGRRVRNKVHSCYFCMKTFINMARHFENIHPTEVSVAKILAMNKTSKQRKEGFAGIIRAGDFNHNCEVLSLKKGELILVRRPTESEAIFLKYTNYGPCPHCLGFMMKKHLWHHIKQCPQRTDKHLEYETNKNVIAESNAIINQIFGKQLSASYLTNIVSKIREDDIGNVCNEDQLILQFGAMLFEKYDVTQCELIRQSMRQLGRLVLILKEISNNNRASLTDFLRPDKFDVLVEATKKLCINKISMQKRPEFDIPSLALKIGYSLKKCASLERGKALKQMNLKQDQILTSFLKIMELEWAVRISSNALSTMYKRKINQVQLLPLTSDLVKLNKFMNDSIPKYQEQLEKSPTIETWQKLASYTLSRIILFNKRRSGEAARMTVENYISRPDWSEQTTEETKNSLTPFERKLTEKLLIVEIEGKRGRKVPVLLTSDTKKCIEILIKLRERCGIIKQNPYIFALSRNSLGHLRGHDCLAKICKEIDLENPHIITGTRLRKYIATVCQLFNLNENEYDWLARHLGHDIRVHREFYRMHESAIELTKVSRLLLAVDSGNAEQFAGKALNEINVEDLPDVEEINEEEVNEDEEKSDTEETEVIENNLTNKVADEKDTEKDISGKKKKDMDLVRSNLEKKYGKNKGKNVAAFKKRIQSTVPQPWSIEEKEVVFKYFRHDIKLGNVPGKAECTKCIELNSSILSNRNWKKIKFCVKNQISKMQKIKN